MDRSDPIPTAGSKLERRAAPSYMAMQCVRLPALHLTWPLAEFSQRPYPHLWQLSKQRL